jgi:hypothetical protein
MKYEIVTLVGFTWYRTEQNIHFIRLVQSTSSTIHHIHKCNSCMKIHKQNQDITFYV